MIRTKKKILIFEQHRFALIIRAKLINLHKTGCSNIHIVICHSSLAYPLSLMYLTLNRCMFS